MISDHTIQKTNVTNNQQKGYNYNEYKFKHWHTQKLKDIILDYMFILK